MYTRINNETHTSQVRVGSGDAVGAHGGSCSEGAVSVARVGWVGRGRGRVAKPEAEARRGKGGAEMLQRFFSASKKIGFGSTEHTNRSTASTVRHIIIPAKLL
jgi:hypothetical protein